jgi:hypothetical protein
MHHNSQRSTVDVSKTLDNLYWFLKTHMFCSSQILLATKSQRESNSNALRRALGTILHVHSHQATSRSSTSGVRMCQPQRHREWNQISLLYTHPRTRWLIDSSHCPNRAHGLLFRRPWCGWGVLMSNTDLGLLARRKTCTRSALWPSTPPWVPTMLTGLGTSIGKPSW